MTTSEVFTSLSPHRERLLRVFGVEKLQLFGSVAEGKAHAGSDIDFLVEFSDGSTYTRLLDLADFLEETLGTRVDLVTQKGVPESFIKQIENHGVRVA